MTCSFDSKMCENPLAWVRFTCRGQSPLRGMHSSASEKQIGGIWIQSQSLFGQLHGGTSCPTPKFSPNLSAHLSCNLMLSREDLKDFLLYSACRRRFPLHLQNFCLYFTFCLKSLCKIAGILQTPHKASA